MKPQVLWRATRAYSLPASVVPVILGTVLAVGGYAGLGSGHFDGPAFAITLLGAILAHFGANVLNDYFDFVQGVDTRPEHGSGVLTGGQMSASAALSFGLVLLGGAAICGLVLLRRDATTIGPLAIGGFLCAVLYPSLLKRLGLGDVLIILAFGIGLTLGAYAVQAGQLSAQQALLVCFYSLPICLLVDAILHANNLRDAADDQAARVRTLATMLGERRGRILQAVLLFGPLVFVLIGVATRLIPLWTLATLLTFPLLLSAYRTGSVAGTAQTHLVFGLLYALSFLPTPVFI